MSEIQKAIEIIKKSNERLAIQIQKVKNTKSKVEAVGLTEKYYNVLENCEKEYEACELAISALQEQAEREKENKPLTLGQLKQMNKKPIWVVGKRSLGTEVNGGMLINTKLSRPAAMDFTGACNFADYGKTWLAYAREPVSK
ncbi:MAG: hypothetical protein M0R51_17395 [Clostridia bacterium]|jgi:hypothetical protein|nr:hypothetical protein [Clostridia bacterium]